MGVEGKTKRCISYDTMSERSTPMKLLCLVSEEGSPIGALTQKLFIITYIRRMYSVNMRVCDGWESKVMP